MVHFVSRIRLAVWHATSSVVKPFLILSALLTALAVPVNASSVTEDWLGGVPEDGGMYAYEISRKGKRLGFQTLEFAKLENGDLQVDVHIEIDFKIIIPLFTYTHDNREIWRDGKMLSLKSRTDNNGEDTFVDLRAEGDRLVGAGTDYENNLSADFLSTSYFNPNFVRQSELVSSQDGRLLKIAIEEIGRETLNLEIGTVEATRFRLTGKLRIDIWYTDDGRWVKTEFTRGGNTLVINQVNPASVPARNKWRRP